MRELMLNRWSNLSSQLISIKGAVSVKNISEQVVCGFEDTRKAAKQLSFLYI